MYWTTIRWSWSCVRDATRSLQAIWLSCTSDCRRVGVVECRVKSKMAGIRLDPDALCTICQQELFQIRKATRTCPPPAVIAFHCS